MIHTQNLSFWYPEVNSPIIDQINLAIQKNETIAIIGPNGSGKTTLGWCLCGIIPHLINGKMEGDVVVDGKNTKTHPLKDTIGDIGIIFQDPDAQFVTLRVKDELAFGLKNIDLPQDEMDARVTEVVEHFGLSELLNSAPQDLSMGQKQKVALASVIAMKPKILLLDEPASTLDPRGQKKFLGAIGKLKKNLTVVLLTHNFDYVKSIADRVIVIHDKMIRFDDMPDLITKKEVLQLFGVDDHEIKNLDTPSVDSLICVENISYRYPRSREFSLDDVSFVVNKGEVLGIVGPNGSGKSTLLLLMHGLLKASGGMVLIDGKNVSKMEFPDLARKQGILFQNPNHQIFTSSIKEELSFGLKNIGLNEEKIEKHIALASDFIKFGDLAKDPHALSYGQRKLLSLATVLAMNPEIILLDEPELGMDIGFMRKFEKVLLKLNRSGKTFVIVSHDLDLIEKLTHRIIFLEKGKIIDEGATKQTIDKVRGYFDQ